MGKPRGGNYHWVDNHIVRATRYEGQFTDWFGNKRLWRSSREPDPKRYRYLCASK